jgi:hypothetical protein
MKKKKVYAGLEVERFPGTSSGWEGEKNHHVHEYAMRAH